MKEPFFIDYTICETEIPTLPDGWITNTPVKTLCPQKNFHKNIRCLSVRLLNISHVFFLFPVKLCIGGLHQIVVP